MCCLSELLILILKTEWDDATLDLARINKGAARIALQCDINIAMD